MCCLWSHGMYLLFLNGFISKYILMSPFKFLGQNILIDMTYKNKSFLAFLIFFKSLDGS